MARSVSLGRIFSRTLTKQFKIKFSCLWGHHSAVLDMYTVIHDVNIENNTRARGVNSISRVFNSTSHAKRRDIELNTNTLLTRRSGLYSRFKKTTRCNLFLALNTGMRIVGQKVSTKSLVAALSDCLPSSPCIILREYWS